MNISATTMRSTLSARGAQSVAREVGTFISCNDGSRSMLHIPGDGKRSIVNIRRSVQGGLDQQTAWIMSCAVTLRLDTTTASTIDGMIEFLRDRRASGDGNCVDGNEHAGDVSAEPGH